MRNDGLQFQSANWLQVRNDSSEAVPAFGVMEITGTADLDDGRRTVVTVTKPTGAFRRLYLINTGSPIPALSGSIYSYGWGTFATQLPVMTKVSGTPAVDQHWGVRSTNWYLENDFNGFTCVGAAESGQAVFLQDGLDVLWGKTDASHAKDATGTISIFSGQDPGSDTTLNITGVYNRYADLDSTKQCTLRRVNGAWELIAGEC